MFDHSALDYLILTRRHWWLMETSASENGPSVLDAFRAEQTDRQRVFDELTRQYDVITKRWDSTMRYVVPDTNFFLHHAKRFDEANWREIVHPGPTDHVRIVVPIVVVRELDRTKSAAKNIKVGDTEESLRTRARRTIRELRSLFANPDHVTALNRTLTVELLLDGISHRPMEDGDSEIIDRTRAAKRLTGQHIAIVTGDAGMEFTAKVEGVSVIHAMT
jgi:rRNA-processing protein FCF1